MKRTTKYLGALLGGLLLAMGVLFALAVQGVLGPPPIPSEVVDASVIRRAAPLDRAFQLPVAERYGRDFFVQSNGSLCGPASLVNVLRSIGADANDESDILAGTGRCSSGLCWMGLTLDELAEVARHPSLPVPQIARGLSPEMFLARLLESNDPKTRMIVNFSREPIFGMGGGHHSPIGGYLETEDLVLVLDVRAEYGAWLVERERLYAAMNTKDGERDRGLLIFEIP